MVVIAFLPLGETDAICRLTGGDDDLQVAGQLRAEQDPFQGDRWTR